MSHSADPWEKSHLSVNQQLTSKMTAYTPSHHWALPGALTHTALLFSYLRSHEQQSLPLFSFLTLFGSHTHTHTLGASLWRERKREEEIVRGGHSWRNVSSVTVTFDGDECASFLAAASRPSGFAASASQFPDEEQQVLHEDPKMILKSCLLRWCVFELLVKCASHWVFFFCNIRTKKVVYCGCLFKFFVIIIFDGQHHIVVYLISKASRINKWKLSDY